jgi:8-oxo-dGTP diphosphatase / 2-hydroxy-dATP diphosphatase
MKKIQTLGLIIKENKILLGMKKRGFGQSRWNGFGGKLIENETIQQAMIREFKEECNLDVEESRKQGIIEFEFKDNPDILEVHIYKILKYSGEPKETEEMLPKWFDINQIPYEFMWPDDIYWLPLFLKDKFFKGKILFQDQNTILKNEIKEVSSLMNLRLNANAIITNNEGKILLVKLKKGSYKGGLCIPGGGIDPGELGYEAAKREILEETGINITNKLTPIGFCELMHEGKEDHRVALLFHSTSDDIPKETEEGYASWLAYEEAKDKMIPFAKEAIKMWKEGRNHFKLIGEETGITKDWTSV